MTPTRSQTGELELSDKGKAAARKETLRIFHGVRDRDESHYEALHYYYSHPNTQKHEDTYFSPFFSLWELTSQGGGRRRRRRRRKRIYTITYNRKKS